MFREGAGFAPAAWTGNHCPCHFRFTRRDRRNMLETARYLSHMPVQGIKFQLLHVLKNTDLASLYEQRPFHILTLEEYTDLVIRCIELLPPEMVIHRITGD